MKRTDYITKLTTCGYSATELSRMSNENLHATYLSARPLLEKRSNELVKVITRERKRSIRLRSEIAGEQQNRQAIEEYHRWSQSRLPKPIVARRADICGESMPQNPDVQFVSHELRAAQTELRRAKQDLKRYGGRSAIQKCEQARMKVQVWEAQMQEVSK